MSPRETRLNNVCTVYKMNETYKFTETNKNLTVSLYNFNISLYGFGIIRFTLVYLTFNLFTFNFLLI